MPPHSVLYVSTSLSIGVSTRNRHGSLHRAALIFGDTAGAASAASITGAGATTALPLPPGALALPLATAGFASSPLPHAHRHTIQIATFIGASISRRARSARGTGGSLPRAPAGRVPATR